MSACMSFCYLWCSFGDPYWLLLLLSSLSCEKKSFQGLAGRTYLINGHVAEQEPRSFFRNFTLVILIVPNRSKLITLHIEGQRELDGKGAHEYGDQAVYEVGLG